MTLLVGWHDATKNVYVMLFYFWKHLSFTALSNKDSFNKCGLTKLLLTPNLVMARCHAGEGVNPFAVLSSFQLSLKKRIKRCVEV